MMPKRSWRCSVSVVASVSAAVFGFAGDTAASPASSVGRCALNVGRAFAFCQFLQRSAHLAVNSMLRAAYSYSHGHGGHSSNTIAISLASVALIFLSIFRETKNRRLSTL